MDTAGLFAEHHTPLFRYLSRLTGDPDVAEDAAQEAFVRLMEKPPAPGETKAWLFRVGTNAAWMALRTRGRRRKLLERAPGRAPLADPPVAPDAHAEAAEVRARVQAALEGLTPRDRQILMMQQEGFRYREIAEAVGTTTQSVGTMIARALNKLAAELRLDEEDGWNPDR
jgi:RNA polymerase sigma-70 factor (ECF subfamily)